MVSKRCLISVFVRASALAFRAKVSKNPLGSFARLPNQMVVGLEFGFNPGGPVIVRGYLL